MLMKFSQRKPTRKAREEQWRGRSGHRVARINDSLFVIGGSDSASVSASTVHRINCQNSQIDSLILDNIMPLEGFSLFSFQETLFVWGGSSFGQHTNQLMQFDGIRFTAIKQTGDIPSPRSNHSYTTFGGKFLILFAGNSQNSFFKDWYLLNLKTFEWTRLIPSIQLNYCSEGKMLWMNGRGILLLNEVYDQQLNIYHSNLFFQFYVTDFNKKILKIIPIDLKFPYNTRNCLFNNITQLNSQQFILFQGGSKHIYKQKHLLTFIVNHQTYQARNIHLQLSHRTNFEPIVFKNHLYLIGGYSLYQGQQSTKLSIFQLQTEQKSFTRHVCMICKLYYDQQWINHSQQSFQKFKIKQEIDHNYRIKIDNRVIQRFAYYIRQEFYAFNLILECIKTLQPTIIDISFHKINHKHDIPEIAQQNHQYLKIGCILNPDLIPLINNQILMEEITQPKINHPFPNINQLIFQLKLGTFRLTQSIIIVSRINNDQLFIIYYSSDQLSCIHTNHSPFTSYNYIYNTKNKTTNSNINRNIIFQNLKSIFHKQQQYQDITDFNLAIFLQGCEQLQTQINITEQNNDLDTGQTSIICPLKQDNKRIIPLIQLAFLPNTKLPEIYIDHSSLSLFNLYDLLKNDAANNILEGVSSNMQSTQKQKKLIKKMNLFYYPQEYWFKKILIYHKGRLIKHLSQIQKQICGIIELHKEIQLDLGGNNVKLLQDKLLLQNIFNTLKRNHHKYLLD